MVGVDVAMKATAVSVTGVFSLLLLWGNPRKSANQYLAFFLLLIAGNQTAEMIRSIGVSPALDATLFRVAAVFAALDPFFLFYFVGIHPERNELNRPRWVSAVAGACLLMLVAGPFRRIQGGTIGDDLLGAFLNTYWAIATAVIYGVALLYMGRRLLLEETEEGERYLFMALCAAVIPAVVRVLYTSAPLQIVLGTGLRRILIVTATGVFLLAFATWGLRGSLHPSTSERTRRAFLWGIVIGCLLAMTVAARPILFVLSADLGLLPEPSDRLRTVREISAAVRWSLFSLFASMAVLRTQMLGQSLADRRRAARGLVAVGVLAAGAFLLFGIVPLFGAGDVTLRGIDVVLLGLLLVTSQGFQRFRDKVAEVVYGVPPPGDPGAAFRTYRDAVREAIQDGRDLGDPGLERLKKELGLEQRTVSMIHEAALGAGDQRLAQGVAFAGRYMVGRRLGQGSAGRVFLAHDEVLDRDVVLKEVIHEDEDLQAAAVREAQLAGGIQHPNVVTVHDVLHRPGSTVLVTEFAAGGSLADKIDAEGRLAIEEGVELFSAILSGLQVAHEEGIVHRDLKPANVLLTADGRPMLGDFGVARIRTGNTRTMETAEVIAGTPEYMAPEQVRGEVATVQTDIYAAGLLLDRCIEEPQPPGLQEIKGKAMAETPEERWASAERMREVLLEVEIPD